MASPNFSGSNGPRTITPTLEELKASSYDAPNIEAALEALNQDGFVVLKRVVDVTHVDHLNSYMTKEADHLVKNNVKPFNQGVDSNILQGPPLKNPDYLYNDVFFNPFVIQILNAYLGAKPIFNFITGNNALPRTNGLRQPVHKDITFFHPQAPFFVIANVPLCPFNPRTGSTEFWLGSHGSTSGQQQVLATPESTLSNAKLGVGEPTCNVLPEVVEARRLVRPPIQPSCEKGDIMLRDLRTWHAGMPNESEDYRIMLALGYQISHLTPLGFPCSMQVHAFLLLGRSISNHQQITYIHVQAQWYPNHTLRFKAPLSQGNFFMKHNGQPVEVRADLLPDDSDFGRLNEIFEFRRSVATEAPRPRL